MAREFGPLRGFQPQVGRSGRIAPESTRPFGSTRKFTPAPLVPPAPGNEGRPQVSKRKIYKVPPHKLTPGEKVVEPLKLTSGKVEAHAESERYLGSMEGSTPVRVKDYTWHDRGGDWVWYDGSWHPKR